MNPPGERHLGVFGATAVGVGAIVGGGILALAGVAFAATGPSAMLAFALNGGIAFLTAASFAELAVRFPQSGGTYTYAKRVLSIEVAFVVGWVVWFASIVAGVLYALGFAAFVVEGLGRILAVGGEAPVWLRGGAPRLGIALAAAALYTAALVRHASGGGNAATIGKVVVFVVLVGGGTAAWLAAPASDLLARLDPFLYGGAGGLVRAMGYTFIALQGFDLIAAVAGEVKDPERNLPRSMYLSLGIALLIYLPLLFLIATVGAPADDTLQHAAAVNPEGLVAEAVERFLGPTGYWLVIGAGLLSMLSALQANVLGASRVAFAMARDRTLPRPLGRMRAKSGTPAVAVVVTAAMLGGVVLVVGDVGAAGAASSLIFLVSFATVHWAAILARRRSGDRRIPWGPSAGALLCLGLAVFQAFAVREAGSIVAIWLVLGAALYLTLLAPGARLADASAEAIDPNLARLRGRSPLVLVPIANPASAAGLVGVASTVRTPGVGRILLLSVVQPPAELTDEEHPALRDARAILGESLQRSFERGMAPETLFTIAPDAWQEIPRVAALHRCETVVLGAPRLDELRVEARLEGLISRLGADVVIVRAQHRWRIASVRRVLVPIGGRRAHSQLRARLLASLSRLESCHVTFLRTVAPGSSPQLRRRAEHELRVLAQDEAPGAHALLVEDAVDPREAILRQAGESDLVVMGIRRDRTQGFSLGDLVMSVARDSDVPLVLIAARPPRRGAARRAGRRILARGAPLPG
ncbi:MAG: amino acid permease [Myxococcales bacterium]|nr:amino acid permease [Myxococcales bacterium]